MGVAAITKQWLCFWIVSRLKAGVGRGGGGLSNLTDGFVSISFGPVILIKKV